MIHKTMAEAEADREELKINLCYTEMNAEDQEKTLDLVLDVLKQDTKGDAAVYQKDIAKNIKGQLDSTRGGTWNVIVGQSFGSFISHESKTVTHFFIGNLGFLIWRHG